MLSLAVASLLSGVAAEAATMNSLEMTPLGDLDYAIITVRYAKNDDPGTARFFSYYLRQIAGGQTTTFTPPAEIAAMLDSVQLLGYAVGGIHTDKSGNEHMVVSINQHYLAQTIMAPGMTWEQRFGGEVYPEAAVIREMKAWNVDAASQFVADNQELVLTTSCALDLVDFSNAGMFGTAFVNVPEPTGLGLVLMLGAALSRRVRRLEKA